MGRFNALLISLLFLIFVLPLWGQDSTPTPPAPTQRVPSPPENAGAEELEQTGDGLRSDKAFLDAIDYYRAACVRADSSRLHNKIGISLFLLQRGREARKEYERSIKMDKNYPDVHNNLGVLFHQEQRYGPAVREYKKAIRLNDDNASYHYNLGQAYFFEKDYEGATKQYSRALELDPSIFERQRSGGATVKLISTNDLGKFHYVMAEMYAQHGDAEHCRYYLAKANEEGYNSRDALRENVFAGLRKDPAFVAFVRSLKPPTQEANQ